MGSTSSIQKFGVSAGPSRERKRRKYIHPRTWPMTLQLRETKTGFVYRLFAPECDIRVARELGFTGLQHTSAQTANPVIAQKYIKYADDKTAAHIIASLLTSKEG